MTLDDIIAYKSLCEQMLAIRFGFVSSWYVIESNEDPKSQKKERQWERSRKNVILTSFELNEMVNSCMRWQ